MKEIKYSFWVLSILIINVFVSAVPVQAQELYGSSEGASFDSAELYVTDVVLDKDTYSPGDALSGTFIIHNINDFDVNDAKYTISYVSEYGNGHVPYIVDDTSDYIQIPFLKSKSKTTINFNYSIPLTASGSNPGINITSYLKSGLSRGWSDADITLSEQGLPILYIESLDIKVGDQYFKINTGPTIRDNNSTLETVFRNESDQDISLTPQVTILNQFNNDVVYQKTLDSVVSKANDKLEYSTPLIFDGFAPAVYLGELKLVDGNGVNRIPDINFRYIIGGEIGNIHSVYTDVQSVNDGDVLSVLTSVSGSPVDITNFQGEDSVENSVLELVVYDTESNKEIGSEKVELGLLSEQDISTDIKIKSKSDNFTISAILYGSDGKVLDEYNNNIPRGEWSVSDTNSTTGFIYKILVVLIGLIIIIIIALLKNKLKGDKSVTTAIFIALVLIGSAVFLSRESLVYAGWAVPIYYGGETGTPGGGKTILSYAPIKVFVNSPLPPEVQEYQSGETFNFQVNFTAAACNNGPQNVYLYTQGLDEWTTDIPSIRKSINGVTDNNNAAWWANVDNGLKIESFSEPALTDHNDSNRNFSSSGQGGYVVPNTGGTYDFYFYIRNIVTWLPGGETRYGWNLSRVGVVVSEDCADCADGEGGGDGGPDGICKPSAGPFSTFPTSNSLLCDAGMAEEGSHTETDWNWVCQGTETDSEPCTAEKIVEEIENEFEVVITSLGTTLTNSDQCVIEWDVLNAGVDGYTCSIINEGSESVVADNINSDSYNVDTGNTYRVECTDNGSGQTVSSETSSTCIKNPTIIEQ